MIAVGRLTVYFFCWCGLIFCFGPVIRLDVDSYCWPPTNVLFRFFGRVIDVCRMCVLVSILAEHVLFFVISLYVVCMVLYVFFKGGDVVLREWWDFALKLFLRFFLVHLDFLYSFRIWDSAWYFMHLFTFSFVYSKINLECLSCASFFLYGL